LCVVGFRLSKKALLAPVKVSQGNPLLSTTPDLYTPKLDRNTRPFYAHPKFEKVVISKPHEESDMNQKPKPEPLFITTVYAERMVDCANRALRDLLKNPEVTSKLCMRVLDQTTDKAIRSLAAKTLIRVESDPAKLIRYSHHPYFQEVFSRLTMIRMAIVARLIEMIKDAPSDGDVAKWLGLIRLAGSCDIIQLVKAYLVRKDRDVDPYYLFALLAKQTSQQHSRLNRFGRRRNDEK
jgi:hypothetical protein